MDEKLRLEELYRRLDAAYAAENKALVFVLCGMIAHAINRQSYQDGVARLAASIEWEKSRKASNSNREDRAA